MAQHKSHAAIHTVGREAMRKKCSVYFRGDDIYVISSARTKDGLWIDTEPRVRLQRLVSVSDIGATVVTALNASRDGVPTPTDLRSVGTELAKFLGVKSLSSFERRATYLSLTMTEDKVTIVPTERGERGGFVMLESEAINCSLDPAEIGGALIKTVSERESVG
jgi:hypothetical protein